MELKRQWRGYGKGNYKVFSSFLSCPFCYPPLLSLSCYCIAQVLWQYLQCLLWNVLKRLLAFFTLQVCLLWAREEDRLPFPVAVLWQRAVALFALVMCPSLIEFYRAQRSHNLCSRGQTQSLRRNRHFSRCENCWEQNQIAFPRRTLGIS